MKAHFKTCNEMDGCEDKNTHFSFFFIRARVLGKLFQSFLLM